MAALIPPRPAPRIGGIADAAQRHGEGRPPSRRREAVADAALHVVAMGLMLLAMLGAHALLPVLAGLLVAECAAGLLVRRGWRVHGSFVDLIAVTAALALPLAVGAGHEHGSGAPLTGAFVLAAWALTRWAVGIRSRAEWAMAAVMAGSMVGMLLLGRA